MTNWIFLLYTTLAILAQIGFLMLQISFCKRGCEKLANLAYAGNLSCIPMGMYFVIQL